MRPWTKTIELPVNYLSLTQAQRAIVRQQYVKNQNNLCYFCKGCLDQIAADSRKVNAQLFPKNFFKHPTHLHHCHKTGMTLGAVHAHCNAVLWQYYGE